MRNEYHFNLFYVQGFVLVSSSCCNKIPQVGWFKQQTFISRGSGRWSVSTVTCPPGFRRLLFPRVVSSQKESNSRLCPLKRALIMVFPPSRLHLNPVTSQRPHPQSHHSGGYDFNIGRWVCVGVVGRGDRSSVLSKFPRRFSLLTEFCSLKFWGIFFEPCFFGN